MSAWFNKKPKLTPRSQYPLEIQQAIHTMDNDFRGEAMPEIPQRDPLVAFQPEAAAAQGAPFYVDPSIAPSQETMSSPTAQPTVSPFLVETADSGAGQFSQEGFVEETPETETVLEIGNNESKEGISQEDETQEGARQSSDVVQWLKHFRWIIGGILLLIVLIAGGVWWWMQRTHIPPEVSLVGVVAEPTPMPPVEPEPQKPVANHYSTTQPNLLSFDTEAVTAESIRTEFLKVALAVKQDNLQGPVEFLVRDQNYNPLAFSRLAYLLGVTLTSDLLATLDEEYSLYFVLDSSFVRMGLRLQVKNNEAFVVALARDETLLPKALEPFFLDTTTAPKTGLTFRSGLYKGQPVRYTNIDQAMNLSLDSSVMGNAWVIGTSQNTLHSLIDHLAQ